MTHPSFQSAAWYQALTLAERAAGLRAQEVPASDADFNAERAERRFQRWRAQVPFGDEEIFARRLANHGLDAAGLRTLLGESAAALRERHTTPPWLHDLEQVMALATDDAKPLMADIIERIAPSGSTPFLGLFAPFMLWGYKRLQTGVDALAAAYTELPFDAQTVVRILLPQLPPRLLPIVSRTLVLELNAARVNGVLAGSTAEERFQHFLERLQQTDHMLALLSEYSVLTRQVLQRIDQWVEVNLEFLQRLCADWPTIRATYSPDADPGLLQELDGGLGDLHKGGRSVAIAHFASGFKIVYKPKPLAIDVWMQELLSWLNQRGAQPPLRTMQILDRGSYGWVEFIHAHGCSTTAEIERFYQRQGSYLALFYALAATDLHHENLIAAGEHPVIIDLESLFHPNLIDPQYIYNQNPAQALLSQSVSRVGLLPSRLWADADSDGVDISGLGGQKGQLTPRAVPTWEAAGTDSMRLVRRRIPMPGAANRPSLNGDDVDLLDYTQALVEGFSAMYRLLLANRDELLAADGILARCADFEIRIIMRPTQRYSTLLYESFHPDMFRNALDRDRMFDRLWMGAAQRPLERLIPCEQAALWRGDVPMFTGRPNSRDAWSDTGEHFPDFCHEPGLDLARRQVMQLSDTDLPRQVWIIRASLTALVMGKGQLSWSQDHEAEPQGSISRDQLLAAACAAGDRLSQLALYGAQGEAAWLALSLLHERTWALTPVSTDMYNGISGIALFLGYLGAISGEERYTMLAQAALQSLRLQIEHSPPDFGVIGGFSGWGGIIYVLAHLGTLWQQPELFDEAERLAERVPALIERDKQYDIIAGAAGCICGLLNLYRVQPTARILEIAKQCGEHLLASAQTINGGLGWPHFDGPPLAGFSHGAAGIAVALVELAAHTGDERFQQAAQQALNYERSIFSPEVGNWPDLRARPESDTTQDNGQPHYMNAWCHGAPGVGMGRIHLLRYQDDPLIREEIAHALRSTRERGFRMNQSLCHGALGNLEVFQLAALTLNDAQLWDELAQGAAIVLAGIQEQGWVCGVPLGVETPGLMMGIAGIGYGLLRLAEPQHVPSVLIMEPPITHAPLATAGTALALAHEE